LEEEVNGLKNLIKIMAEQQNKTEEVFILK